MIFFFPPSKRDFNKVNFWELTALFVLFLLSSLGQQETVAAGAVGRQLALPFLTGAQLEATHVSDHCCGIKRLLRETDERKLENINLCLWRSFLNLIGLHLDMLHMIISFYHVRNQALFWTDHAI